MGLRGVDAALPPGFRFYPSDEELVSFYLRKKVANERVASGTLVDVDLHACEPWELPGKISALHIIQVSIIYIHKNVQYVCLYNQIILKPTLSCFFNFLESKFICVRCFSRTWLLLS
jgi:hypothetical protein